MPLETIPWSKTAFLGWSDFGAEPNPAAFEDASSTVKYRITWVVNSESVENKVRFFIEDIRLVAEFFPWLSWVRRMYATPGLLKHEQGHFDLAELLRKDITAKIRDAVNQKRYPARGKDAEQQKQFARERSALLLSGELKKWQAYLEEKQSEYDSRTSFGHDAKAQSVYDRQFSRLRD